MAFKTARVWTKEEIDLLESLVQSKTWAEIGSALNVHPETARHKARELGLRKKKINRADGILDRRIFDESEKSGQAITAKKYNVSIDRVKNARRRVLARRKRCRDRIDGENFHKFRNMCIGVATNRNMGYLAEEFADWAVLKALEGDETTSVKFIFAEFVRHKFGEAHTKYNKDRRALFDAIGINDEHNDDEMVRIPAPEPQTRATILFNVLDLLKVRGIERVVFLLHYKDGFEQEEIAEYVSLARPRIGQILEKIIKRILKNNPAKELLKP